MDKIKTEEENNKSNKVIFERDGYLLFKAVYNIKELKEIRSLFRLAFKNEDLINVKYNSDSIINDIYKVYPNILDTVINKNYIRAIKSILGESIIWLPECSVHYNRFDDWHKDTTEQELKGVKSHKNENQFLLQCATYFQSNSNIGGGLTVIPGSHLNKDRFLNLYKKGFYMRAKNKLKKYVKISVFDKINNNDNQIQIQTEIGDLLIFDVRLDHKATRNSKKSDGIEKFAIFNTFGNDNAFTSDYLNFMKARLEPYYQYLQNTKFPDILYNKAAALNIKIWD